MNTMQPFFITPPPGALAALCVATCMAIATPALAQSNAPTAPTAPTAATAAAAPKALPSDSLYRLDASLTDQDGRAFKLRDHLGRPVLVSMFYTSCQFVCPMLIEAMEITRKGLTMEERAQLDLLLVSFDPERDDVKKLKAVATAREADARQWTLARTDASSARKIAATLGIQYRQLADGEFNHSTVLVLLDGEGRIVGRTKKLGAPDPEFIKLVKKTLHAS